MIYLPSPEAVAHEAKEDLAKIFRADEDQELDAVEVVKAIYAAIDRCTTQRVTVDEPAPDPNPKA